MSICSFVLFFPSRFICLFWLHWISTAAGWASSSCSKPGYASLRWCVKLGLQSTGSVAAGHRLGCPRACGIFPNQGENPGPLHGQEDSSPLDCQGSPVHLFLFPDRRGVCGGTVPRRCHPELSTWGRGQMGVCVCVCTRVHRYTQWPSGGRGWREGEGDGDAARVKSGALTTLMLLAGQKGGKKGPRNFIRALS